MYRTHIKYVFQQGCFESHTLPVMTLSPFDASNTFLSLSSSYMPASMLIDVSFFTSHCSGPSPVWEKLAGGRFNDADLCVCMAVCTCVCGVCTLQKDKLGRKLYFSAPTSALYPLGSGVGLCLTQVVETCCHEQAHIIDNILDFPISVTHKVPAV